MAKLTFSKVVDITSPNQHNTSIAHLPNNTLQQLYTNQDNNLKKEGEATPSFSIDWSEETPSLSSVLTLTSVKTYPHIGAIYGCYDNKDTGTIIYYKQGEEP